MPLVVYTLLRAAILLVAIAGLYLLGMRGLLLAAAAILVAALLSYVLLPRQRAAAAVHLAERGQRRSRRTFADSVEDDARAEDEAVEGRAEPRAAEHEGDAEKREHGAEDEGDAVKRAAGRRSEHDGDAAR